MKIALTGGGTAGHAMVNQILTPMLLQKGWNCIYIGSKSGAEKSMFSNRKNIPYFEISTGKLRRYFSFQNVTDIFRVLLGIIQAFRILKKEKPDILLSGGGFVSVPAVFAAHLLKIPVLIRETDYTVGLANRLCIPFARKLIVTFPDTLAHLKGIPGVYHGLVIRPELISQPRIAPMGKDHKPTLLVMGGSLGARRINSEIRNHLPQLLKDYQIIHLCGKGNGKPELNTLEGYMQYEYTENIGLLYRAADVVITRCGSNAVSECLALGKNTIYIPLPGKNSRGEQQQNAAYACAHGNAVILNESEISLNSLQDAIRKLLNLPSNKTMTLTLNDLTENCDHIISELENLAWETIKEKIRKGQTECRHINWSNLTAQEIFVYNELFEAVGE